MMMVVPRVYLDLASRGFGVLRAAQWVMTVVIFVAAAYTAWLWWEGRALETAALPYEAAAQRVFEANNTYVKQARQAGYDLSEDRLKGLDKEVTFANQMVAKHAFSWTRFLTDLEETVPPHISIGSVGLSFKDGVSTITLSGAAKTLRDLTVLAASLEAHAAFQRVVLSHHQNQSQKVAAAVTAGSRNKDTPHSVEFSLTVMYRPPLGK